MIKYMILNPDVMIEYGNYDVTLLQLKNEKIYSLFGEKFHIFKEWHKYKSIDTECLSAIELELYKFLEENNIVHFSDKIYIVETELHGKRELLYNEKKCKLSRVFIEIANSENTLENITSPCWVCLNNKPVFVENETFYSNLIGEIAKKSVDQIVLYGGDILNSLNAEALMQSAQDACIQLCVLTNANCLSLKGLELAIEYDVVLVITIDFTKQFDFEQLLNIVNLCKNKNVIAKYSLVFSKNTLEKYMQEKDHVDRLEVDVINLSLQMDDVISDIELSELCWLEFLNETEFKIYSAMNTCMAGEIAINSKMEVLPCPHMHNFSFGKIFQDGNGIKFKKEEVKFHLSDFWLNHKEHICECLECSKKNICMDCRKAEMDYLHSNNLSIKRKCAYLESCKEENK